MPKAFLGLCCLAILFTSQGTAAEPLHVRIDKLIDAKAGGPLAAVADDATFLRRVYLDLAGEIPAAEQVRKFLADKSPDKRAKLIDRLLAGKEYPRRMTELFNVMLMERRGEHEDWTRFLRTSFEANKPWDQMVREILYPNTEDENIRGAALFYTKRLEKYGQNPTDTPGMIRDFGRLFLGVDVQCAQCHDHLFVKDYKQQFYHGLYAYIGSASIRRDVQFPAVGEKWLNTKVEYKSVFGGEAKLTGPWIPGGKEVEIPVIKKGEEFSEPPDRKKRTPGVLKFSTLKRFSEQLPSADNSFFKRNIANRLWWVMMGRGLVHPLDLSHGKNPASHPELLDLLAKEFAAHKFDIQWMLRELALSQTYQRSSLLAEGEASEPPPQSYRVALEKSLSSEQLLHSILLATGQRAQVEAAEKRTAKEGEEKQKDDTEDTKPQTLAELHEHFNKALANPPREPEVEYTPMVKAALFLSNDELLLAWLKPVEGNLVDRLKKTKDDNQLADELYLSTLSRLPTAEEKAEVVEFLKSRADRRAKAIGQYAWALLASTEFCVNH